jgi:hypothetical protein
MSALNVWYGPAESCRKSDEPRWDQTSRPDEVVAFVCAPSWADAKRLIEDYCGQSPTRTEFEKHWRATWPGPMKNATRKRGLWLLFNPLGEPVQVA